MDTNLMCTGDKSLGLCEPPKGVRPQRCTCRLHERRTKEVIENGLKIVRVRFCLPAGELPYLEPSRLSIYLLSLLSSSPSGLPFPRMQKGFDSEGFPLLMRLGRLERWRLAQAVASIKRSIPVFLCKAHPPPSCFPTWHKNQCTEARTSSPEYRSFARKVAAEVFVPGWDSTYRSFCRSFVPKSKSRAEKHPCGVAMKSDEWWSTYSSREEFLSTTIRGKPFTYDHPSRFKSIATPGKARPMVIPSASIDLLGPLHKTLYQHMASQPWLLKGKPSVDRLKEVLRRKVKTSIDLVNASDGLTIDICEILLDRCQSTSDSIPSEVYERAHRSLTPLLTCEDGYARVRSGQMMGQYLCFPMLCFQSYVAARWATREIDACIRINGDDCLIGSDSYDVVNRYPAHLRINFDKTAVRESVAEINSTQFIRWGKKWKEVVTARRLGGDHNLVSGLVHLAQSCREAGDRWITAFVRTRIGRRSRVSPVSLGLPVTNREVFWRNRGMPHHRILPDPKLDNDERLEKVSERPCLADTEELRDLLFNHGRYVPDRDVEDEVKKLPYRKVNVTNVYLKDPFATCRRVCRGEKKTKKEIFFRVRRDPVPVDEKKVPEPRSIAEECILRAHSIRVERMFSARSKIFPFWQYRERSSTSGEDSR
ncbi:RNA dependent RNA polymerase [Plasmopara viticola lesion associated ourmia-like virus 67]|uniref:RNA dependent RNA polymerase n=1 Tax=Plasmopara viticola lesion associated ourmia-like virus 67 TaxID=2686539 RepID=A0ABX6FIY7_9VIRU|nr:RNA dependent RNA polymerase [Plasmopara viticola lesion associated ourmia-like virus 67]QGY72597.1 RNA dependent RNA polymerase [Plasmopara viticola lesion associated ourmia-like virus 67]